jgi:hypothetical protein
MAGTKSPWTKRPNTNNNSLEINQPASDSHCDLCIPAVARFRESASSAFFAKKLLSSFKTLLRKRDDLQVLAAKQPSTVSC